MFVFLGPDESNTLGSILLPSYQINPCTKDDGISRKWAFKVCRQGMVQGEKGRVGYTRATAMSTGSGIVLVCLSADFHLFHADF